MNAEQLRMARHALGLPNPGKKSYRNRYFSSGGSASVKEWQDLIRKGFAHGVREQSGRSMFWLTHKGALLALEKHEMLCPEDFPTAPTQGDEVAA